MKEIKKIIIRTEPSFGCADDKEYDKLIITSSSISYYNIHTYTHIDIKSQTTINEILRKWKYETDSHEFKNQYKKILTLTMDIMENKLTDKCLDGDMYTFTLYDVNNKRRTATFASGIPCRLGELYKEIEKIIPEIEKEQYIFNKLYYE